MKILILCLATLSFSVFANAAPKNYTLAMTLSIDGKTVATPTMQVKEGKLASFTQTDNGRTNFIDVTTTEGTLNKHTGILMDFKIGRILKDGTRKIDSTSKILSRAGEKSTIEVISKENQEKVSMAVVATRI